MNVRELRALLEDLDPEALITVEDRYLNNAECHATFTVGPWSLRFESTERFVTEEDVQ